MQALLQASPRQVLVVDNLLSAERENLPSDPRLVFIEKSITDDATLRTLPDVDVVFHLATYHGNQNSMADPLADHENNTLTTLKLFERIRSFRTLKRVVYSSAGCTVAEKTFGPAEPTPEDKPVSLYLDTPYQISKIIGEYYANYYHARHALPVVKARFQNVYGPGEVLGAGAWRGTEATVWRNVAPTFVYRALKKMPLPVENGGVATRDFIYVDDIVRGLMLCATVGKPGEVYNVASGVETSILDLAQIINRLTGSDVPIDLRPKRDWDRSGRRLGSTVKAARDLGFSAETSLDEGLKRTIAWTRENMPLIDACIAKHAQHMKAAAA